MTVRQVEATILGQSYMLACPPEGEQRLQQAVALVDREMCAIRDAGKVKARERIAVLTALNLAYQRVGAASAEPPAAAEPAGGGAAAAGPGSTAAAPDPLAAGRIEALIERIDRVLGGDGKLL